MQNSFYREIVNDHNIRPAHKHMLPAADLKKQGVNPGCGDDIMLELKIRDGIIEDVKFETFGCASAVASSSMATELIKGQPVSEAMKLTNKAVAEALDGLPDYKMHCSVLAEEAIRNALNDYYSKQGTDHCKDHCTVTAEGSSAACCVAVAEPEA